MQVPSHDRFLLPQTGTVVRVSSIVTQLVFEHALRIRMKAETSSSARTTPVATPNTRSEATTPDNVSIASDNIEAEPIPGSSEDTVQSAGSSTFKGKQKEDSRPATPVVEDDGESVSKSSNLVGKMNNLVSTDLENLVEGRDFLLFGSNIVRSRVSFADELHPRSFVSSPSSCSLHLVLVHYPWLECNCWDYSNARSFPSPRRHRK
jgi:hypothetical protein